LVCLIGFAFAIQTNAQSVNQKWVETYNGSGNTTDKSTAMVTDASNNVYVTGKSKNGANYDFVTVKYNSAGVERWMATYAGPGCSNCYGGSIYNDEPVDITVDASGNVYVTGKSYSVTSTPYSCEEYTQCQLEDAAASLGWTLSLVEGEDWVMLMDVVYEMCQDGVEDGSLCLEGGNYDYATVKYNSKGVEQWVARYNGTGNAGDYPKAIDVDNAGNVYVTGNSYGVGTLYDWATVKYNANGVEQWVIRSNGYNNGNDAASDLAVDGAGNLVVVGQRDSYFSTMKINPNGVGIWGSSISSGVALDKATSVTIDDFDNVYVTGESHNYTNGNYTIIAYMTVKYSANGTKQWSAVYKNAANEPPAGIEVDGSGNVYVTGTTPNTYNDDYVVLKYNSAGAQEWIAIYDGAPCSSNPPSNPGNVGYWCVPGDHAKGMAIDDNGNVYVTGTSYVTSQGYDIATVKFNTNGGQEWVKTYNGSKNGNEGATAIAVDGKGKNIYVSGSVVNSQYSDYATIKYTVKGGKNRMAPETEEDLAIDAEESIDMENRISIYPNPTNGIFMIETGSQGQFEVNIYGPTGQLVIKETLGDSYQSKFDLSEYPKGIYFIQLISGGKIENRKIVVQ